MCAANVLEVENLSKTYSGHTAVRDISFSIRRGEIVGFLGPNGAGKSTTMKILSTYQPATSGTARVAGHDVFHAPQAVQRSVGYMPEHNPLPLEMRVSEYLGFRAQLRQVKQRERLDTVMEECGLREVRQRIIGQLSKGYRQRVGLADALLHQPDLVILDEPTSGLDPNQIRSVRDLIRSLAPEMTVLLSTHILPEVELTCDRVIILHQGTILTDEPTSTLRARHEEQADILAEIAGPEDLVRQKLGICKHVANVTKLGTQDGYHQFKIKAAGTGDPRPQIFDLTRDQAWRLRELRREECSLEDIFSRITAESPSS